MEVLEELPSVKTNRVSERKRLRNAPLRSAARTHIRRARNLIDAADTSGAMEATNEAVKALDKAAQKGAIHPNNASRRKSRIMKQFSALSE